MPNGISNWSLYVIFSAIKSVRLQKPCRKSKEKTPNVTHQAELSSQYKAHLNTI